MLAYNILRLCGQESLRDDNGTIHQRPRYRKEAGRRRIRTVMQDLIYIASHLTSHSRKWYLSFGRYCVWNKVWQHIYKSFTQKIVSNNIGGALCMGPWTHFIACRYHRENFYRLKKQRRGLPKFCQKQKTLPIFEEVVFRFWQNILFSGYHGFALYHIWCWAIFMPRIQVKIQLFLFRSRSK